MKRKYYALRYESEYAFNDSLKKMRVWSTAWVLVFENKDERDKAVEGHYLIAPLTAEEAYWFIGRPGSREYADFLRPW